MGAGRIAGHAQGSSGIPAGGDRYRAAGRDRRRFFGAKFRAGVLYGIHEKTGSRAALEAALERYRAARELWSGLANRAKGVYLPDITVGELRQLRGHWIDRLPDIDSDIAAVAARLEKKRDAAAPSTQVKAAIAEALGRPAREIAACTHKAPARFVRGQALELAIAPANKLAATRLYYRHVNQAERYESAVMEGAGSRYLAAIPVAYTASSYPLEYYFELRQSAERVTLFPGFNPERTNQPYFVVRPGA